MKEHKHNHCEHLHMAYCSHCQCAYCKDCGEEWPKYRWNYHDPYPYRWIGSGITQPQWKYDNVTTSAGSCSHT